MHTHPPLSYTPEVSRGDWIRGRLDDWSTITGVIPHGFEAYARVFHPIDAQLLDWNGNTPFTVERAQLRWQDIAARMGTVWHPLAQWSGIIADHRDPGWLEPGWQYGEPRQGALPLGQLTAIAAILTRHTTTPELGTAGLWGGYGGFTEGSGYVLALTLDVSEPLDPIPVPPTFAPEIMTGPSLELPGRSYLLFECAIPAFADEAWNVRSWGGGLGLSSQTPNLIWPADRAWCLASEIDFDSTLIGGSRALIDEVVASPDLEAAEITADASLTHDADLVNRPAGRD